TFRNCSRTARPLGLSRPSLYARKRAMRKTTLNEHVKVALLLLAGICGQGGCASGPATGPDTLGPTYAGAWMGTTSEGTAIAFDVSEGNIVTHITIGRDGSRLPRRP